MTSPKSSHEFNPDDQFDEEAYVREISALPGYVAMSAHKLEPGEAEDADSPYTLQRIVEVDINGEKVKYRVSYLKDPNEAS